MTINKFIFCVAILFLSACGGGGGGGVPGVDTGTSSGGASDNGSTSDSSSSSCASDASNGSGYYSDSFGEWKVCLTHSGNAVTGTGETTTGCGGVTGAFTVSGTVGEPSTSSGYTTWDTQGDFTITLADGVAHELRFAYIRLGNGRRVFNGRLMNCNNVYGDYFSVVNTL